MIMKALFHFALHITIISLSIHIARGLPLDPCHGFEEQPFNESFYHIQKPFDVPVDHRYRFSHGIHKFWVLSTDKPFSKHSPTKPRTEISINGYVYSTGVWQFEAYGYVPGGTSGVCIMQVHLGYASRPPHATTLMLRVYDGSLTYYRAPVIEQNIYDRWFRLNVIHDTEANKVKIYINGVLKHEAPGSGSASYYFKCGVYAQNDDSHYMESRWKKIRVLRNVT